MVGQSGEGVPPPESGQEARDTGIPVPLIAKTRLMRSRRQMYLQIVAGTVILACGIIIGAGATLLYLKDDIVRNPGPPPGDVARDIQARYGLTDEQTRKVEAAVKESGERMRTFFQGMKEKMDAESKQLSSAMKGILTSEQFKRWEMDLKSRRGRRPSRFGPGGPGSGGRPGGFHGPGSGGRPGSGGPGSGGRPDGRPGPDDKFRRDRFERPEFGPKPRGPAEPNSNVKDES